MDIELHSAFVWDCDHCGVENYERAIEGNIDEAALAEADVVHELIAVDVTEVDASQMEAGMLVQRICVAPKFVTCKACRETFPTTVPMIEDHDE